MIFIGKTNRFRPSEGKQSLENLVGKNTAKSLNHYLKYEGKITRFGWIIFLGLMFEDFAVRAFITSVRLSPVVFAMQLLFFALFYAASFYKSKAIANENGAVLWKYSLCKSLEIIAMAFFISTMHFNVLFYFVALLPIAFISLTQGFRKALPYILLSWVAQTGSQLLFTNFIEPVPSRWILYDFFVVMLLVTLQYLLFCLFCYIWGSVYDDYARSEEENNVLIDRLGDKYVQLDHVKKEIQAHYDKLRETNEQLEESNRRLTSSLAEFYTLQQISQAISSIFDMNELLKFVNDVIIGVMGVYHSTIALCHGSQNHLKVQVTSIFEKSEMAIMTDFINSDVLKPSIDKGHSMIDNNVSPEAYPFTQGRDIRSLICVPLQAKGRALGIVLIEHSMKGAFDSDNVRLLEIIAQQISIAIENARLYQQMHDLATKDGLTQAYNRQYFQDKLLEEHQKASEEGYDLSLILFDIDHFKHFNDNYGHLFGDLVLKSITSLVMKALRKQDIFARYGGEEFVVLLPRTTLEQAAEKAEDIRSGIASVMVSDRIVNTSVTVSIGVASFPKTSLSPQELIRGADGALYESKDAGRNCLRLAKSR